MYRQTVGGLVLLSCLLLSLPSFAQIRGESSSEFFRQGQDQINDEINRIENQRDAEEEKLEQTLDIEQPKQPEVQEVPTNLESLDDNVPESPEQEVEVKF